MPLKTHVTLQKKEDIEQLLQFIDLLNEGREWYRDMLETITQSSAAASRHDFPLQIPINPYFVNLKLVRQ